MPVIQRGNLLSIKLVFICSFIISFILVTPAYSASDKIDNSAVILMYHNVADSTHPSTSVSTEMFKKHMQYIAYNGFTVWPLFKTLTHLATGKPIPDKTVVITFDDAYKSVYNEAFPVLKNKGWPFTVFVTTKYIGEGYTHFMSWNQLRDIQRSGGEIGNHSLSHAHFVRQRATEDEKKWRERIINEIQQAQSILKQEIINPIPAVAYPYGEYSRKIKTIVHELGYFGLGQNSGAVSYSSDFQALPRFPMATGFDSLEDFALKISTRPLPVTLLSPKDGLLSKDTDIPVLTLRLEPGNYKTEALTCFASGQGRIQVKRAERQGREFRVKANESLKPGRTKYTCTAPSESEAGIFYWFSFLWMKPEANGEWYKE